MNTLAAFAMGQANRGREMKVFDWALAAKLIAAERPRVAEAGLIEDWGYTRANIWESGLPVRGGGAYLASTWATPSIMLDGQVSDCFRMQSDVPEWDANTCWPESVLPLLSA